MTLSSCLLDLTDRASIMYRNRLFLILVSLCVFICAGCTPRKQNRPTTPHDSIVGIDVSHHNGTIKWDVLSTKDKIQFVFIKATEGATVIDENYSKNAAGAKKAGIKVGAYHFFTTASSAEKQFSNFKNTAKATDLDLLPVLDAEAMSPKHSMSKGQYVKHARKWVDLCKKEYGKAPIIYSSVGFYRKYLKGHFDDCPFWTGDVYAKQAYVDGEQWVIWQKTIRKCHGTSERVDYNVLAKGKTLADISLHATNNVDGIDVSHHRGIIDWPSVKKSCPSLSFVYVKCTEGKDYVDAKFKDNILGAAKQGYKVGGYHFFRMTSSAHDQFHSFRAQLDNIHIDLVPMVDVEKNDNKPRKELQDSLRVFLNLIEQAYGKKPMIYGTNRSFNELCAPEFNDYPMYIGRYGDECPRVKGPSHYTIWQYSETGKIAGIPKEVDLCRFHPDNSLNDILL